MNFKIDLKSIDLKNISLDDIQAKLKNVEKKTWIKLGTVVGAVVFFLIIFYGVLNPIVKEKKSLYEDKVLKESEITQFEDEIIKNKKRLKKLKPQFKESSTLFHSKAEVEGLYQTLSVFAGKNNLVISKIEKKDIKAMTKADAIAKATGKKSKGKKNDAKKVENIAYYKIPVDFEIKGNFLGYIKFKRQLSLSQKMLNFDKESIQVLKGDTTGAIKVNGTLTIVGLADEFF